MPHNYYSFFSALLAGSTWSTPDSFIFSDKHDFCLNRIRSWLLAHKSHKSNMICKYLNSELLREYRCAAIGWSMYIWNNHNNNIKWVLWWRYLHRIISSMYTLHSANWRCNSPPSGNPVALNEHPHARSHTFRYTPCHTMGYQRYSIIYFCIIY